MVEHLGLEAAVEVTVDLGMFQKFPCLDAVTKVLMAEEVIVPLIDFALSRRAGGAGNGIVGLALVGKTTAKSGFPGAGRSRDKEKNARSRGHRSRIADSTI
jgi:hypothetical protein